MRRVAVQIIFGVLVASAGVLMLLEATALLTAPPAVWILILAAAGATFAWVYFSSAASWWAAIPSSALLGAATVRLMEMDPDGAGQWTEVPFLAALSVGFWAVYLRDSHHWWALIPAGLLLTIATATGVTAAVNGATTGAIFLIGAALTFVLVAVLPGGASRHRWAWIPASVLTIAAIAVLLNATGWFTLLNILWPIAVIMAGGFLIWRALDLRRTTDRQAAGEAAEPPPAVAADS